MTLLSEKKGKRSAVHVWPLNYISYSNMFQFLQLSKQTAYLEITHEDDNISIEHHQRGGRR